MNYMFFKLLEYKKYYKLNKYLFLVFILLFNFLYFFSNSIIANDDNIKFSDVISINRIITHLTTNDGLSDMAVSSIVQDKYGFLWIGTKTGLNRYDGYEFKKYFFQPYKKNSLPHNLIQTLYMDKEKNVLWIGTYGGLSKFDLETETFTNFTYRKDDEYSISDNVVVAIGKDKFNRLWVGTLNGLNRYDEKNNRFIRYFHKDNMPDSIPNNVIRSIYLDSNGRLWIGSYKGISLYDYKKDSFVNFRNHKNRKNIFPGDFGMSITEDKNGTIWIGAWYVGLVKYDEKKDEFITYEIPDKRIYKIVYDAKNNQIDIGTWGGGLYIFDINTEEYFVLNYKENEENIISDNVIYSIFVDKQGILWAGTYAGGLNKIIKPTNTFQYVNYFKAPVISMLKDSYGYFWIGTDNNGLFKYDLKTRKYKHYKFNEHRDESISNDIINVIFEDSNKNIWIGTNRGLNLYNREKDNFKRFFHNENNPDTIADDIIYSIVEDNRNNIWFGTYNNGISVYNLKTKKMRHYFFKGEDGGSLSNNLVYKLFRDSKGRIWAGTNNGLNLYDKEKDSFIKYYYNENDKKSLSSNSILTIYEDSKHFLWIGTRGGGLDKFIPEKGVVRFYNEKNGLINSEVKGIVEDQLNKFLWVVTSKGISYIDLKNEKCFPVTKFNGIIFNNFYRGVYSSKNSFFVGIKEGILIGKFQSIKKNNYIPDIYITNFKVFGKDYKLNSPLTKIKQIKLKHKQKFFSFEFAILDFYEPEKNLYAYKLKGFDKNWNYIGNRRYISYTNLNPGNYILQIKGSNNNGIWNEKGKSISIKIVPEWYETTLAKIIYVIITILFIIFVYFFMFYLRLNKIIKKKLISNEEKQKILEARQKAQDEFFSNLTHDIRNPLNSIVSYATLLKIFAKQKEKLNRDKLLEITSKIERITFDLSSMLNNILEFSRLKSGKITLFRQKIDLKNFLNSIFEIHYPNAKIKNLAFSIEYYKGVPDFIITDKEKLKRIMNNLIDNAIKYTEKGFIKIEVFPSSGNNVKILIKDSGPGISKEFRNKLFDEWSRNNNDINTHGFGLGLSIVKKYVDILGSTIEYKENIPEGSIFVLILKNLSEL